MNIGDLEGIAHSARQCLSQLSQFHGSEIVSQGTAFGDAVHDMEIRADHVLGELIRERLCQFSEIGKITIEGLGTYSGLEGPLWVTVDPLDGSLNYATRSRSIGLPYTLCMTVVAKRTNATFRDVLCALVFDFRTGDVWTVDEGVTLCNHQPAQPISSQSLDIGKMIVIGEMYYPSNRELLAALFAGEKGWLRNPGSAAYEMALVAEGYAVAMVCDRQKQHELGAGYALVRGAGGVVVDFDGIDIGHQAYDFTTQTPVILARDAHIAEELVQRIHRIRAQR